MNPQPFSISLKNAPPSKKASYQPDSRDGRVYDFPDDLKLATEIALVTGRPLLLRGDPGSGKSSFAPFVARNLKWRYYEVVVTARTEARDLMWSFDTIRRLNDAQKLSGDKQLNDFDYIEPGPLWWVFDRQLAAVRGDRSLIPKDKHEAAKLFKKIAGEPYSQMNASRDPDHAVLLIDEIDKGDPDVPNNLLVPLGSRSFTVSETRTSVERKMADGGGSPAKSPLVIITTNQERALPQAILRRCIIYKIEHPGEQKLVEIAKSHHRSDGTKVTKDDAQLFAAIAKKVMALREQTTDPTMKKPSTAEFLDAVRACRELGITADADSPRWGILENLTLKKQRS